MELFEGLLDSSRDFARSQPVPSRLSLWSRQAGVSGHLSLNFMYGWGEKPWVSLSLVYITASQHFPHY